MVIVGFEKFTTLDYPGHLSALIYTFGCTMKCPFCHNPELVTGKLSSLNRYTEKSILDFLVSRKGQLEALAITGGEPSLHSDLIEFITKVKNLGFKVKLDTYGLDPYRIKEIIDTQLVDYWAMDVKGNSKTYSQCGYQEHLGNVMDRINDSIKLIINSGADYEFRTTVLKSKIWHTEDRILEIAERIKGARNYYLQNFRALKTLDPKYQGRNKFSFTEEELQNFKKIAEPFVEYVGLRS